MILTTLGKLALNEQEVSGRNYCLLAYLAINDYKHSKEEIANLFYLHIRSGNDPIAARKRRLNQAIGQLGNSQRKQSKRKNEAAKNKPRKGRVFKDLLSANKEFVEANNTIKVDVNILKNAHHEQKYQKVIKSYTGPFLSQCELGIDDISPELASWINDIRAETSRLAVEAYSHLITEQIRKQKWQKASELAYQMLAYPELGKQFLNQDLEKNSAFLVKTLSAGPEEHLRRYQSLLKQLGYHKKVPKTNIPDIEPKAYRQDFTKQHIPKIWQARKEEKALKELLREHHMLELIGEKGIGKTALSLWVANELQENEVFDISLYFDLQKESLTVDNLILKLEKALTNELPKGLKRIPLLNFSSASKFDIILNVLKEHGYEILIIFDHLRPELWQRKITPVNSSFSQFITLLKDSRFEQSVTTLLVSNVKNGLTPSILELDNLEPATALSMLNKLTSKKSGKREQLKQYTGNLSGNPRELVKTAIMLNSLGKNILDFDPDSLPVDIEKEFLGQTRRFHELICILNIYAHSVSRNDIEVLAKKYITMDLKAAVKKQIILAENSVYKLNPLLKDVFKSIDCKDSKEDKLMAANHLRLEFKKTKKIIEFDDLQGILRAIDLLISLGRFDMAAKELAVIGIKYLYPWGYYSFLKAIISRLVTEMEENILKAKMLNLLGLIHKKKNHLNEAINYHKHSIDICRKQSNPYIEMDNLLNLASLQKIFDRASAISNLNRALALALENPYGEEDNSLGAAYGYIGIQNIEDGEIDLAIQNLRLAINYLSKVTELSEEGPRESLRAAFKNHLGNSYFKKGDIELAKQYLSEALEERIRYKLKGGIAQSLNNLAKVIISEQKYVTATAFLFAEAATLEGIETNKLEDTVGELKNYAKTLPNFQDLSERAIMAGDSLISKATNLEFSMLSEMSSELWLELARMLHLDIDSFSNALQNKSKLGFQLYKISPFFEGRKKEIEDLSKILSDAGAKERIVNIVGPAGIGKTQLALAVGNELLESYIFKDGVFLIRLEKVFGGIKREDFLAVIFKSLLIPGKPELDILIKRLETANMLLIFNNFEQLSRFGDVLITIAKKSPGVRILVSSRKKIRKAKDIVKNYELKGLVTATDIAESSEILSAAAVKVLLARAKPNYQVRNADFEILAELSRLTEGNPLTLKLLAAEFKHKDPIKVLDEYKTEICEKIKPGQTIEHAGRLVLEAGLQKSFDELPSKQKTLVMQLSVFPNGASKDALKEITGYRPIDINLLSESSLVSFIPEQNRYYLKPRINSLAAELLAKDTNLKRKTLDSHARYYLQKVYNAYGDYGDIIASTVADFEQDINNIYMAYQYLLDTDKTTEIADYLYPLICFLDETDRQTKALAILKNTLKITNSDPILLARTLAIESWIFFRLNQIDKAQLKAGLALEIEELSKTDLSKSIALNILAGINNSHGNYRQALKHLEAATQSNKNHPARLADTLGNKAIVEMNLGYLSKAAKDLQASINIFTKLKKQHKLVWLYLWHGHLQIIDPKIKDKNIAVHSLESAIDIAKQVGLKHWLPLLNFELARAHFRANQYKETKLILNSSKNWGKSNHSQAVQIQIHCLKVQMYIYDKEYSEAYKEICTAFLAIRNIKLNSEILTLLSLFLSLRHYYTKTSSNTLFDKILNFLDDKKHYRLLKFEHKELFSNALKEFNSDKTKRFYNNDKPGFEDIKTLIRTECNNEKYESHRALIL